MKLILLVLLSGCGMVGGVAERTLDPDNAIYSYEYFFNVYEEIQAKHDIIEQMKSVKDLEGEEAAKHRVDLQALRSSCRSLVGRYNANAAKANKSIFLSNQLPQSIEPEVCE